MGRLSYLYTVFTDLLLSSIWTRILGIVILGGLIFLFRNKILKIPQIINKHRNRLIRNINEFKNNPHRFQEKIHWKVLNYRETLFNEKTISIKDLLKKALLFLPALFVLTIGNALFRAIYAIPLINKQRKRFQKEMKPIFYFKSKSSVAVMGIIGTLLASLVTNYAVNIIRGLIGFIARVITTTSLQSFNPYMFLAKNLVDYSIFSKAPILAIPVFIIFTIIAWKSSWINFEQYRNYNANEAGDDQFTEFKALERQYKKIPNKTEMFEGHGGIPMAHKNAPNLQGYSLGSKMKWRNKSFTKILTNAEKILGRADKPSGYYFIDDETKNALYIGMTRSGKGETFVNPTIDIISRAKIPSSMIIADPKGELYQSSYDTLRKRGFDVEVLSFQNMDFSMSYNPFELAIQAAKKGYYEKTQTLVNSVAESIYRNGKQTDGKNAYWENSAIGLFNAITMALIDRAKETFSNGEKDAWETITIRNVATFLIELGSEEVLVDVEGNIVEEPEQDQPVFKKSKLTVYFDNLRKINRIKFSKFREMADLNFQGTNFAGEETKGNVYSNMVSFLTLYLQDNVAKLTSKNSIDMESVGNPRRMAIKFRTSSSADIQNDYRFQTAQVNIYGKQGKGLNATEVQYVKNASAIIDGEGYLNYVIAPKLPDKFRITVDFNNKNNDSKNIVSHEYEFKGEKIYKTKGLRKVKDKYTRKPILDRIKTEVVRKPEMNSVIENHNIEFVYSDKPKAIFLVTPPNRPEYNAIASFFINQLFNANYEMALNSDGRKTVNRIQFILDEFANIPAIPKMDEKLSIGLGQNIQFMLFIQNYGQLVEKYGKEVANSIMGNCSINAYLKSTDPETQKKYSTMLGTKTITKRTKSGNVLDESNPNIRFDNSEQSLLTETQLAKLQSGEAVIIRGVKGEDNAGRKVTTDPIFASGETEFPHRYMFLNKEFDQSRTLSDIPVESKHRHLELREIAVDATTALDNIIDWKLGLSEESFSSDGEAKLARRNQAA